jgi:hypothetical protein
VEYKNNNSKVNIICSFHGTFEQIPRTHLTHGCPSCKESNGEKKIAEKLTSLNINYIREYKFKECIFIKELPFDFYLPDKNMCIEFHGKQHFESIKFFGGDKKFQEQKIKDDLKKKFCKKNNIEFIEIRYDENIENKLIIK